MATSKFVKGADALMQLATKKAPAAKKADDKKSYDVSDSIEVSNAIDDYLAKKQEMDSAKAAMEAAGEIVKSHGIELWANEVEKTTKTPESFILANHTNGLLFIASDAYKTTNLTEEHIAHLQETYGDDIIDIQNKFVINPELLDKYGAVLYEFIQNSKKIADEDRTLLIQVEQKTVIRKGTIDRMFELAKKTKQSVLATFQEIMPTVSLKARGKSK